MTLGESCNEHEHTEDSAVRRNNRVLRRLTRALRRRNETGRAYADALFVQLCATSPTAELAMRELWEKGDLGCSPEDYESVVESSLEAIRFWSAYGRPKLAPVPAAQQEFCATLKTPEGWMCTRYAGHEGPCAAVRYIYRPEELELVAESSSAT